MLSVIPVFWLVNSFPRVWTDASVWSQDWSLPDFKTFWQLLLEVHFFKDCKQQIVSKPTASPSFSLPSLPRSLEAHVCVVKAQAQRPLHGYGLGSSDPLQMCFFPSVPEVETWPNMIVFRFPGTIGPYVITHSSNWWDGVTCLFSIRVFFVCLFFFSSANIIGTWEKKNPQSESKYGFQIFLLLQDFQRCLLLLGRWSGPLWQIPG